MSAENEPGTAAVDAIRALVEIVLDAAASIHRFFEGRGLQTLALFTVVSAIIPFTNPSGFEMTVITELFLFGVLALSWDLIGGQTGYPSFGNMAFFGIGAYTTAILVKSFGVAFPLAFVVAALLAVAFAAFIGVIVLRLRGGYFAIATLGVLLASQQITRNLEITGGASGIILLQTPTAREFYYLFLGILVVEALLVMYLTRTRFGLVLNAIRDDEGKATAMGYNTTYYKTAAWMLAALFTGVAGGAWSLFNTFVDPITAYNTAWNVEIIAMALLGGSGTVVGPILGAFGLHALIRMVIDTYFTGWQLVVLGAVVITTVIAMPKGIVGTIEEHASAMEYYKHGGQAAADSADSTDTAATDTDTGTATDSTPATDDPADDTGGESS